MDDSANTRDVREARVASEARDPWEHVDPVALLHRTATAPAPDERLTIAPALCPMCGWDQFEVVADECFCEGCCLPLGIEDGGVHPNGFPWTLTPARHAAPTPPGAAPAVLTCPEGHDLFEVAVACTTTPADEVRRISVALRCTEDGTASVHVDNATVTRRAPCSPTCSCSASA
ncbi:hypothetical protein ACFVU3_07000 [Streptomyces sp. NPDC058052]|uniref:hypothetical protein n=1 Tax=Streptomyces sp. NPDC058052 TaxID=3346316 RepID=UPI0036F0A49C